MAGGPNTIVLQRLRAIRGDMARLTDAMRATQTEMTAMPRHFADVVTLQQHDHGEIAAMKARLDRIERRLERAVQ